MARWQKLGLVAGGGGLPARIVNECEKRGELVELIKLAGTVDEFTSSFEGTIIAIGEAGKIVRHLRETGCDAVCFAGTVSRPDFASLKVDWRGAALLPRIVAAAAKGDGAILNVLVDTLEGEGFRVIGADDAVGDLVAEPGPLGEHRPGPADIDDIAKAAALINAIGPFDVGQGAVVASGHVLAIEAAEGTDLMLQRCERLVTGKGGSANGVIVKRPKPGQELRVDLPVIGPQTVRAAAAAGLRGIAVEAGYAIILERDETRKRADDEGIFVYGFTASEISKQ